MARLRITTEKERQSGWRREYNLDGQREGAGADRMEVGLEEVFFS